MNVEQLKNRLRRAARRHVLDALDARGLVEGTRVVFPRPGQCVLETFEEAQPGPGEMLVETLATIVSPGTERAVYLRLPNVSEPYPHVPGYSQAGRVIAAGHGAAFQVGETVATRGAHASLYLCPAGHALGVPLGVSPAHAALTSIAFIAMQAVRKAGIEPGERVLVLGAGLIGQLSAQLAALAGGDVTVAARGRERLAIVEQCGMARALTITKVADLDGVEAAIVIDATGHPDGAPAALRAAAPGARVILVGSPRGVTRGLDVQALMHKQVSLLGAHTNSVPASDQSPRAWTFHRETEAFLRLVELGRLNLEPLFSRRASPDEAPAVYAELARPGDTAVAVLFDWTRPGHWHARVESASPLRLVSAGAQRLLGRPAAATPLFLPPRADGRRLRFGLVGCGEIAAENAAALRAASNATITAATDPNLDLARSLAAATGARASRELAELLASPDVDAVLISTPHHLHAPLAIQAAEAGKHVVVEKPMGVSVDDCDRMIAAARQHGVALSVCYCQRYDPRVQAARRLIDAGAIGEVLGSHIRFGQWRGAEYWEKGLTGRASGDWRARRESSGGGVLIMNACHILDYMSWLVGSPIREVTATIATLTQPVEVEDTAALSYRYGSGAVGTLQATTTLPGPGLYEQHLWGREGQIVVAPQVRLWSKRTVGGRDPQMWHDIPTARPAERRHFFEAFAAAVLDGTALPVTADEARTVQASIEAAYRSADTGTTVTLQP